MEDAQDARGGTPGIDLANTRIGMVAAAIAGIGEAFSKRGQGTRGAIVAPAEDAREARVIALLEDLAGGRFVYRDGRAWLLRDEDAIHAESRLGAAHALLVEVLLERGHALGARGHGDTRQAAACARRPPR